MSEGRGWWRQNLNIPKADEDEGVSSRTTPRPSFSSPTDNPRTSIDKPPKRAFPTAYTTPHDAMLADMQSTLPRLGVNDASNYPASTKDEQVVWPSQDVDTAQPFREALSSSLSPNQASSTSPDLLFDPYDGTSLGTLLPHGEELLTHRSTTPETEAVLREFVAAGGVDNTDWRNLAKVLDIQSQISKMHMEMENIGTAKATDSKNKRHQVPKPVIVGTSAGPSGDSADPPIPPGLHQPRRRAMSTISTVSSSGQADDEGVNVLNEEDEKLRLREEEFAKLANQFEGRKEAIGAIMSKLDDLSQALCTFSKISVPADPTAAPRRSKSKGKSTLSTSSNPKTGNYSLWESLEHNDTVSNRTHEWAQNNAVTSPPTSQEFSEVRVMQTAQKSTAKKAVPTLMLNSLDLNDSLIPITDSPTSFGSKKALPVSED